MSLFLADNSGAAFTGRLFGSVGSPTDHPLGAARGPSWADNHRKDTRDGASRALVGPITFVAGGDRVHAGRQGAIDHKAARLAGHGLTEIAAVDEGAGPAIDGHREAHHARRGRLCSLEVSHRGGTSGIRVLRPPDN